MIPDIIIRLREGIMFGDTLRALWIVASFLAIFFWFPSRLSSQNYKRGWVISIAGGWVRMALCAAIAVVLLPMLKVLTAITVIFLLAVAFLVTWLYRHEWKLQKGVASLQRQVLGGVRRLETRFQGLRMVAQGRRGYGKSFPQSHPVYRWAMSLRNKEFFVAGFLTVVGLIGLLYWEDALREVRFTWPDQYVALLHAREAMLNMVPEGRPIVFPALLAITSLISGSDPLQTTRFLCPLVACLAVLCLGLLVRMCSPVAAASLIAMYCFGEAAFPPAGNASTVALTGIEKVYAILWRNSPTATRATTEFQLGLGFLFLGLVFLGDWYWNRRRDSLIDFVCCLLLVGMVSQLLLLVFAILGAAFLWRPAILLPSFFLLGLSLAISAIVWPEAMTDEASMILPAAIAVGVGWFVAMTVKLLRAAAGAPAEPAALVTFAVIAVFWLPPHRPVKQPLEYESVVRETEEITKKFPRQKWMLIAPIEQLPETLGLGVYKDLASFVEDYQTQVERPEFRFPEPQEDLFIYVEKMPFQIFDSEPSFVSFSVLTDVTYRNYRSPAGRASLESAAMQLCDSYRRHHSDADIYFEDDSLRIYHIHQQAAMNRKAGISPDGEEKQ
jgi:hypothetical protein